MNSVYPEEVWVGENNLVFRVQYTHPLGTPPLMTQLWIDLNSDGDFVDPGEKQDMKEADLLDTDYTNGKTYYANITVNSDGASEIRYLFVFTDDNDVEATGIPTQVASLTPIQAEEKNICFINSLDRQPNSFSAIMNFLGEQPLISTFINSLASQKLMVCIPF